MVIFVLTLGIKRGDFMKKTPEDIRQANLKGLLEERFDNDIPGLSDAIGRAQTTVSKYLLPILKLSLLLTCSNKGEDCWELSPMQLRRCSKSNTELDLDFRLSYKNKEARSSLLRSYLCS